MVSIFRLIYKVVLMYILLAFTFQTSFIIISISLFFTLFNSSLTKRNYIQSKLAHVWTHFAFLLNHYLIPSLFTISIEHQLDELSAINLSKSDSLLKQKKLSPLLESSNIRPNRVGSSIHDDFDKNDSSNNDGINDPGRKSSSSFFSVSPSSNPHLTPLSSSALTLEKQKINDIDIMICNHQIYNEWLYLWYLTSKLGREEDFIIILKASLSNIPIVGKAMTNVGFIFLSRKWLSDEAHLQKSINAILNKNTSVCLVIFPEGTIIGPESLEKSKQIAEEKNIECPKYVILPRYNGLLAVLRTMGSRCHGIYDITMGFLPLDPLKIAPYKYYSLISMYLMHRYPKKVFIHVDYIPLDMIPVDDNESFKKWLRNIFYKKDSRLSRLYDQGYFDGHVVYRGSMNSSAPYLSLLCLAIITIVIPSLLTKLIVSKLIS